MERLFNEKCGVVGIWNNNNFDVAELICLSMYGIQHRGQQGAGIAVNDGGKIIYHKELGLVSEVFNEVVLKHLGGGRAGLGHVGYNYGADNLAENAQPLVLRYTKGQMAISYNGCLLNSHELRAELEKSGSAFQFATDVEIIAQLLSKERVKTHSIEDALIHVMKMIKGAYSVLIMTPRKIVAARDAKGMKPLCVGKLEDSYVVTSESSGLDTIGAKFIRDVMPGEVIVIDADGLRSFYTKHGEASAMCIFEQVYLARTDSFIDGASVYETRLEFGRILAREYPAEADIVIGVPDSAIAAAIGYSQESGIPYAEGLARNRYIGRTFIQPSQDMREKAVAIKLNALKSQVGGKRVVVVDDSIVRGTTTKKIIHMLKNSGGAKEVHVRISSPPVKFPCKYGIDTYRKESLIASGMSVGDICKTIEADSLGFISLDGLKSAPKGSKCGYCSACFDGDYPLE